jgi:hypothetical protein
MSLDRLDRPPGEDEQEPGEMERSCHKVEVFGDFQGGSGNGGREAEILTIRK